MHIRGDSVLELGVPPSAVGSALALAYRLAAEHPAYGVEPRRAERRALAALEAVLRVPERYLEADRDDLATFARDLLAARRERAEREAGGSAISRRVAGRPLEVRGSELIEASATEQIERALRLPPALAGFLAPDAHPGYGLPIGGVVAFDGAVSPYAVGVDIGCRVAVTVFDEAPGDVPRGALGDAILAHTRFGTGSAFEAGERNDDPVLDDPLWRDSAFLQRNPELRSVAAAQLGSSGGGNHFASFCVHRPVGAAEGAERLALMTHSGSRRLGAEIAGRFSDVAAEAHPELHGPDRNLAWLELGTAEGDEYWALMQLAGAYASANHRAIHQRIGAALALSPAQRTENHHNFAWLERVELPGEAARDAVVHRKGAIPAAAGVHGVIPGSMATPAYLVVGRGEPRSLNSAAHGAGRTMSRGAAKRALKGRDLHAEMAAAGIELIGGALDEAPEVYKPVERVIDAQRDLIEVVGTLHPRVVRMADDG